VLEDIDPEPARDEPPKRQGAQQVANDGSEEERGCHENGHFSAKARRSYEEREENRKVEWFVFAFFGLSLASLR